MLVIMKSMTFVVTYTQQKSAVNDAPEGRKILADDVHNILQLLWRADITSESFDMNVGIRILWQEVVNFWTRPTLRPSRTKLRAPRSIMSWVRSSPTPLVPPVIR